MGHPSSRSRQRVQWRAAVLVAVALVVAVAGYAAWDVYEEVTGTASSGQRAAPGSATTEDPRQQVRVRIVVTSDAPFGFTYVDTDGEEVEKLSEDGQEIALDVVQRGSGPYLQVWAQAAPQSSFVRCRIEVNGAERADERVEGPAAATYCAA